MTVKGDTGGIGTKGIKTKYPVTEGLILGTTKIKGKTINLVSKTSIVSQDEQEGL